tara:strand:- start:6565 stop:6747 length:183 start_codon:yes stop_codon:yes gene_type:complete
MFSDITEIIGRMVALMKRFSVFRIVTGYRKAVQYATEGRGDIPSVVRDRYAGIHTTKSQT